MFSEANAPDWLTNRNTVRGSTMDHRWFWEDHVLTLRVGESVNTDFQTITRCCPDGYRWGEAVGRRTRLLVKLADPPGAPGTPTSCPPAA